MHLRLAFSALLLIATVAVGCGGSVSVPDTPDGMMNTVVKELSNKNPGVLWDAMPASYQTDLESIVHEAAGKMDAEVYDKAFVVLNKALDVLKNKKDFILGLPMLQSPMFPVKGDDLKANWDGVVDVLSILASSDLKSLSSVKSLDVGDFLRSTGGKLMKRAEELTALSPDPEMKKVWTILNTFNAEIVSTEGDTAKIKISAEGEKPDEIDMVKVEGKWVPKDMAEGWKNFIEEMKQNLAGMTGGMIKAEKNQYPGPNGRIRADSRPARQGRFPGGVFSGPR